MFRWQTMSSTQKSLTAVGFIVAGALVLYLIFSARADQPIMIGDSSVYLRYDNIKKNSDTELEVAKALHKVRSIAVFDDTSTTPSQVIDVSGRDWMLKSANGTVSVSPHPQLFGLQATVTSDCPTPWQGGGADFTCVLTDGSQLTPATLTFNDGNCPVNGQPSCPLACAKGKCRLELAYR